MTHPTGLANRNSRLPHDTEGDRDMLLVTCMWLIIFHAAVCMGGRSGRIFKDKWRMQVL